MLITYKSWELKVSGILNVCTNPFVDTPIEVLSPAAIFKVTFWPVLNGWLGRWIVLVGTGILVLTSPTTFSTLIALPDVVPTPTDWGALKKITSFFLDSNFLVLTGILILLLRTSILEPNVCAAPATPTALWTLITFLVLKTFNTLKNSVPIFKNPSTETVFGISVTCISSIFPLVLPTVIVLARPIVFVLTPILNDPVKFTIEVLSPVTEIDELSFNSINGNLFAITSLSVFHSKTTSSNFWNSVSIFEILTPTISSTCALNPEPPVPELSKIVKSPTLYPLPPSKISISFTSPFVTDSIFVTCLICSFDSIIKSLSANSSSTL